jgi:hypothetical protein
MSNPRASHSHSIHDQRTHRSGKPLCSNHELLFSVFANARQTLHPSIDLNKLTTHSYHHNPQTSIHSTTTSHSIIEWAKPRTHQNASPKHQPDLELHIIHLKTSAWDSYTPATNYGATEKTQTRYLQPTPSHSTTHRIPENLSPEGLQNSPQNHKQYLTP